MRATFPTFLNSLISLPQTTGEVFELRAIFLCDTHNTNEHKVRLSRLPWILIEPCSNESFSVHFYIDFCTKQDQKRCEWRSFYSSV